MAQGNGGQQWQERLGAYSQANGLPDPRYNIVSDRRGGRTAWSCIITMRNTSNQESNYQARFWYDGQYINNAREDAAEVTWRTINNQNAGAAAPQSSSSTSWGQQGQASSSTGAGVASNNGNRQYAFASGGRW